MNDDNSAETARLTMVEAEQFSDGNVLIDTTGYGAGIGVILNRGELPNVAQYEVSVTSEDYYQLELRFAAAQSRPVQVFVDDQLVNIGGSRRSDWVVEPRLATLGRRLRVAIECRHAHPPAGT